MIYVTTIVPHANVLRREDLPLVERLTGSVIGKSQVFLRACGRPSIQLSWKIACMRKVSVDDREIQVETCRAKFIVKKLPSYQVTRQLASRLSKARERSLAWINANDSHDRRRASSPGTRPARGALGALITIHLSRNISRVRRPVSSAGGGDCSCSSCSGTG